MSDEIWYAETKTFAGKWKPNLFHGERPTETTVDCKRELRNVRKLDPKLAGRNLEELRKFFNQPTKDDFELQ